MNRRILLLSIAVVFLFSAILSGCGSSTDTQTSPSSPASTSASQTASDTKTAEPVKLQAYFFSIDKREGTEATFKKFTELNPNISIDVLINDQDYYTILKTKIASGEVPDLVMGEYGDLYELGKAGHIQDLSKEGFMSNFSDSIKSQVTTPEGNVYGMPVDISGMGIYYNKDMFKDAGITEFPKTQSGLKDAINKLKTKKYTPFAVSVADAWTLAHMSFTNIAESTKDVKALAQSIKTGGQLKSDALVQGFKTIDMIFENADGKAASNNYGASLSLLAQGKVAMLQQGYWAYSSILKVNDKINLGFAAIPYSENPEDTKMSVNVGVQYAVSAASKNKEAALKLLSWLSSKEGNQILNENLKQIPCIDGVTVTSNPVADDILSYKSSGKIVPWSQVLMSGKTRVDAEGLMQSYYFKKTTVDQVIEGLRDSWSK